MRKPSYVVGFVFSEDRKQVLLLRKNRPDWQMGKLNGVGGKLEDKEGPTPAMIREFREETGVDSTFDDWEWAAHIAYKEANLFIYRAFSWRMCAEAKSITDEKVGRYFVSELFGEDLVENLKWIIPFLLDDYIKTPTLMNGAK